MFLFDGEVEIYRPLGGKLGVASCCLVKQALRVSLINSSKIAHSIERNDDQHQCTQFSCIKNVMVEPERSKNEAKHTAIAQLQLESIEQGCYVIGCD